MLSPLSLDNVVTTDSRHCCHHQWFQTMLSPLIPHNVTTDFTQCSWCHITFSGPSVSLITARWLVQMCQSNQNPPMPHLSGEPFMQLWSRLCIWHSSWPWGCHGVPGGEISRRALTASLWGWACCVWSWGVLFAWRVAEKGRKSTVIRY